MEKLIIIIRTLFLVGIGVAILVGRNNEKVKKAFFVWDNSTLIRSFFSILLTMTIFNFATNMVAVFLITSGISSGIANTVSLVGIVGFMYWRWNGVSNLSKKDNKKVITNVNEDEQFSFKLKDQKVPLKLHNIFRGIFISGGAGAGKSKSLIIPIIQQAGEKDFSGIVYDFKFPTLAREVAGSYQNKTNISTFFVNFSDLSKTNFINPIEPKYIRNAIFAKEAALTILSNIDAKAVEKRDFWVQSAEAIFGGTILYLRNNCPEYCTLPHAVSLILEAEQDLLISKLSEDEEVKGMVASVRSAQGSSNTIASMFATIQNYLSLLNTKELFWVLQKSDFDLVLNDPNNPKMLVVGNDDSISKSLSPIIALIVSTALKQMNQPNRAKSIVIIDEAPTLNLPNFAQIPATSRENKLATVYAVQDIAQMEADLTKEQAEKILANLNNQFYGRTTNIQTADRVSKLFGEYEKSVTTYSTSTGKSSSDLFKSTNTQGTSTTVQLRKNIDLSDVSKFEVGQFACILAEANTDKILGQFVENPSNKLEFSINSGVSEEQLKQNFRRIKEESRFILEHSNEGRI